MKAACLSTVLLLTLLLSGCSADNSQPHSVTLLAMDTVMEVTAYGARGQAALTAASELIVQLEALLSTTDQNSEIYAANHSSGQPLPLSGPTSQLLREALRLCRDTGGALDVSVYPVVRAWGFTTGRYQIPDKDTLAALLERVDYSQIHLDGSTLTLPHGMELDFGAVAKGYTGDRIMELFQANGVTSARINLGGNAHTLGYKPDGSLWRIAIQDPTGSGYAGIVEVAGRAVVTSGSYERYFEQDGARYWHIIDPTTGAPAQSGLASATIVAESGLLADGLSTALFVMGRDRAAQYWRGRGDFDFILIGEDGSVTISEGIEDSFSLYGAWAGHDLEVIRR